MFPLSNKREDTFIAGFSMGGYGALRNGLKYSETFSKIGALSPALVNELSFIVPVRGDFVKRARKATRDCFEPVNKIRGTDKDYTVFLKQLLAENKDIPKIFLACGKQDFLYSLARINNHYLTRKKVDHEFMVEDGGHKWSFAQKALDKFVKWVIE